MDAVTQPAAQPQESAPKALEQAAALVADKVANGQQSPEQEAAPAVETKQDQDFAEQFARIQKKERQLREKERQYQERIRVLEQQAHIAQQLEADPMSVLSQKGWTLDKLLERVATGETPKPTVEDKVSELQKKLDQLEAAKKEAEEYARAAQEKKVIAEYKNQIKTVVDSNASQFEAIKALDAYETVFALAEERFQETGEIPKIEAIATEVEKYLEAQLQKAFELQKFKSRFEPAAAKEPVEKTQETRPLGANTLTATQTAVTKPPTTRKLSDEESKREAARLIRWNN